MIDQILDTPSEQQRKFEYAGFWIRAVAIIIDFIVIMIFMTIISWIAGGSISEESPFLVMIIVYGTFILYFIAQESSEKQATLGKMAVGIKVGDKNGNRISFGRAAGRFFSKIISSLIFYIGYMMAGWDERKQALHDKIADTFVYYSK